MSFLEWLRWPRKTLRELNLKLDIIMATQIELTAKINAATTQLQKISVESSATIAELKRVQDLLEQQSNVSPELQAAVDRLADQIQAVDDLTPDITDGSGVAGGGETEETTPNQSTSPDRFRR